MRWMAFLARMKLQSNLTALEIEPGSREALGVTSQQNLVSFWDKLQNLKRLSLTLLGKSKSCEVKKSQGMSFLIFSYILVSIFVNFFLNKPYYCGTPCHGMYTSVVIFFCCHGNLSQASVLSVFWLCYSVFSVLLQVWCTWSNQHRTMNCIGHLFGRGSYNNGRAVKMVSGHSSVL